MGNRIDPPTDACVAAAATATAACAPRRRRRRHGTTMSRRLLGGSLRAPTVLSCAAALKPGRGRPPRHPGRLQRRLDARQRIRPPPPPSPPPHPATIYTADPKPDQSPPHGQGRVRRPASLPIPQQVGQPRADHHERQLHHADARQDPGLIPLIFQRIS